jgi:predicted RND superfamily exporter protein
VCGAIATDVVGFAALTASRVGPVRDFGIMTAIGAAAVLVAAALALPFVALVASRFDTDPRRAWGEGTLERWLDGLVQRLVRHPGPILAGAAAVVAVAVAGMGRLEVETDFTRNFRADSPTVVAYDMVESRLGGAGVWEVLVPAPDPVDGDTLLRLDRLAARLRSEVRAPGSAEPALTKVLSVVDVLGAAALVRLAPGALMALGVNALALGEADGAANVARPLVGRDPRDGSVWLRLMLRARERQPAAAKRAIIADVRRIAAEEFPGAEGKPAAEVTGFFVLLAQLVDRILADQWLTFGLSAVGIFLLLAVAFASPLLAAVALVPNGMPIFVVLGLLGWAGVRINMGTAMIAAVSLGLSVDSSIHYIVAFRRRLAEGQPLAAALETAHGTAGRAMVFSTLALVVGFLSLTTSGFIPTVSFGWLSCLTLAGGLLGNLVVLPVLLVLLAPWIAPGCQPVAKPLQH